MTTITSTTPVSSQDRVAAAAKHMHAAETFLHTARQAGIDAWVQVAYRHLHEAIAEHTACLLAQARNQPESTAPEETRMDHARNDTSKIDELHSEFPHLTSRIVTDDFHAYLPLTASIVEAVCPSPWLHGG
jgi:hypothetical protein